MEFNLEAAIASTPLTEGATDFGTIRIAGEEVRFITVGYSKQSISDGFGKGTCYIYKGEAVSGPAISRELRLSVYKDFPSTVLVDAVYHNLSGEDLSVDGWSMCDLSVKKSEADTCFWSFQGQSTGAREDWLKPVSEGFYQRNYMGMNSSEDHSDYGGGVPVVCLWRRDAGVIIGHLEPTPELVSLPAGSSIANAQESRELGGDTFYITIDASSVQEFNDIVELARNARINSRMRG